MPLRAMSGRFHEARTAERLAEVAGVSRNDQKYTRYSERDASDDGPTGGELESRYLRSGKPDPGEHYEQEPDLCETRA
jgi:hypothetical protein